MWTFGCINCRNTIPSLITWHEKYSSEGLIIIGNHYPEFDYESDIENLKEAVEELNIPYAVTADNLGETWKAYDAHFWPTIYLIDKKGYYAINILVKEDMTRRKKRFVVFSMNNGVLVSQNN